MGTAWRRRTPRGGRQRGCDRGAAEAPWRCRSRHRFGLRPPWPWLSWTGGICSHDARVRGEVERLADGGDPRWPRRGVRGHHPCACSRETSKRGQVAAVASVRSRRAPRQRSRGRPPRRGALASFELASGARQKAAALNGSSGGKTKSRGGRRRAGRRRLTDTRRMERLPFPIVADERAPGTEAIQEHVRGKRRRLLRACLARERQGGSWAAVAG